MPLGSEAAKSVSPTIAIICLISSSERNLFKQILYLTVLSNKKYLVVHQFIETVLPAFSTVVVMIVMPSFASIFSNF